MLVFYLVSIVVSQESVIFYVICRIYRNVNNFLETFQSSHDPLLFWIFFFSISNIYTVQKTQQLPGKYIDILEKKQW